MVERVIIKRVKKEDGEVEEGMVNRKRVIMKRLKKEDGEVEEEVVVNRKRKLITKQN